MRLGTGMVELERIKPLISIVQVFGWRRVQVILPRGFVAVYQGARTPRPYRNTRKKRVLTTHTIIGTRYRAPTSAAYGQI